MSISVVQVKITVFVLIDLLFNIAINTFLSCILIRLPNQTFPRALVITFIKSDDPCSQPCSPAW